MGRTKKNTSVVRWVREDGCRAPDDDYAEYFLFAYDLIMEHGRPMAHTGRRKEIVMSMIQRRSSTPLLVPHVRRQGFPGVSLVGVQRGAHE